MRMEQLVSEIRLELKQRSSREIAENRRRFHKEDIMCYGLTVKQTQEVVDKFYPMVKDDLKLALKVGENLLKSKIIEEGGVAIRVLQKMTPTSPQSFLGSLTAGLTIVPTGLSPIFFPIG